jgi:hypothetical protein
MGTIKISKCSTTVPSLTADESCSSKVVFALDKPGTISNVRYHFFLCCCSGTTSLLQIFHFIFLYFIDVHNNRNSVILMAFQSLIYSTSIYFFFLFPYLSLILVPPHHITYLYLVAFFSKLRNLSIQLYSYTDYSTAMGTY